MLRLMIAAFVVGMSFLGAGPALPVTDAESPAPSRLVVFEAFTRST